MVVVLAVATQDPLVLVLDGSSSMAASRLFDTANGLLLSRNSNVYKCGDQDAVVQFNDPNRVATVFS